MLERSSAASAPEGRLPASAGSSRPTALDVLVVLADPIGSRLAHLVDQRHPDYDAAYQVEGIGGSVMPAVCDPGVIDGAERVSDEESFATARRLIRDEGLLVGGSSGTQSRRHFAVQWSRRRPAGRLVGSAFIPPVAPGGGLNG